MDLPELLIPAANLDKLRIALEYGADAVYAGAQGISMRPDEASMSPEELAEAVEYTHALGKKIYVGVNNLVMQGDINQVKEWLAATNNLSFDAVIVADAGVFAMVREARPDLSIHISTQMSTANAQAGAFWKEAGADRVILARECSLAEAHEIASNSDIDVEIFIHGAMCMAVSGRCLLSAHLCGHSGSKGQCKHSCRWEWEITEKKRPNQPMSVAEFGGQTIFFGSTDLCLIEHIPAIIESGVCSLKVEGRMKSEYYVATVARVYRAALDCYASDPEAYKTNPEWIAELDAVSHRPYDAGFAFGYPVDAPQSLQSDGGLSSSCEFLGVVEDVADGACSVAVRNPFTVGETFEWIGPEMTGGKVTVDKILNEKGEPVERSHPKTVASVTFIERVVLSERTILRRRIK